MPRDGERTVARHILDGMRATGIRQLFCLPGVQNDPFFDAVVDARDWLEVIVTRHEQGCAYLAMGAAQATGRQTAMCVVPGPGLLNAAAGLSSACGGGARVLAIVGQIHSSMLGRGFRVLHELDDQPVVLAQVTKHAAIVRDAEHAAHQIQQAFDALVSGTPRPVAIEVPADLWAKQAPGTVGAGVRAMPSIDKAAVDAAADTIRAAANPLIWVGSGAQDAASSVRQLADLLQAPVSTRRMGHGVMDETDPLFVPLGLAHNMWADVDLVIGIGSRIEFPLLQWGTGGLDVIQINTDAAELDRHGIGALGIHGDAAEVVPMLLDRLGDLRRADRRAELESRRRQFFGDIAHLEPQLSYLAAIRDALPDDAIIVEDVTQLTFVAHFAYQFRQPRTFLSTGFAGTLGSGTAVGIGAKAGAPERTVVTITGDGGFLFTATELASAVQHRINAITIVVNDGAYGNVRRIQQERFGPERTIASTLVNPDIVAFAESFGCLGLRADDAHALGDALKTAIAHDGPVVIEVPIGEVPSPWPFIVMPRVR
ncbi:MAG TPA: thiamine pyrophosphate-dependent enzyme [Ilumatobacteraceae bacterium]|nr:thiamine pyrophosphate-dependent enzyme [Ilumatobacteraceae bacterium]